MLVGKHFLVHVFLLGVFLSFVIIIAYVFWVTQFFVICLFHLTCLFIIYFVMLFAFCYVRLILSTCSCFLYRSLLVIVRFSIWFLLPMMSLVILVWLDLCVSWILVIYDTCLLTMFVICDFWRSRFLSFMVLMVTVFTFFFIHVFRLQILAFHDFCE